MNHKFDAKFFNNNRNRLCEVLPNHFVVLSAHKLLQLSADQSYPFRQDSSFWYVCGIDEPDLVLTIDTTSGSSTIYLPEQNDFHDEWDGAHDTKDFEAKSGIAQYKSILKLPEAIQAAKKKKLKIGYLEPLAERVEPYGFYANPARMKLAEIIKSIEPEPVDVRKSIARLRQIKQPLEIEAIRSAIDCTATALLKVQNLWDPVNTTEKDIENILTMNFVVSGGHAYEPIVASGKNAATIHYMKNNNPIKRDAFLLMDIGARNSRYAADISRTWFVGSGITDRQKKLYEAVLKTQKYAFSELKPGVVLREYQVKVEAYTKKLFNKLDVQIDRYPHGISHFLGLDVHDAGDYEYPLVENTVLTVEPGIYLPEEGIGIRIEDDIRITSTGIEVMSKQIASDLLYLD